MTRSRWIDALMTGVVLGPVAAIVALGADALGAAGDQDALAGEFTGHRRASVALRHRSPSGDVDYVLLLTRQGTVNVMDVHD